MARSRTARNVYAGEGAGTNASIEGLAELQQVMETMLRNTEDLRPAWPIYHQAYMKGERAWFDSSGDGTWTPLSRKYARSKGNARILRLTDALYLSETSEGGWHIYEPTPRYVRLGTRDPVANIHFSKKRKKRRPMDVNSPTMQAQMVEAIRKHAEEYAHMWSGADIAAGGVHV